MREQEACGAGEGDKIHAGGHKQKSEQLFKMDIPVSGFGHEACQGGTGSQKQIGTVQSDSGR